MIERERGPCAARPGELRVPPQREYLDADRTWGARHAGVLRPRPVAYFSAEFGLHESVSIYSGGLGVLAGDHIRKRVPTGYSLVGIGFIYARDISPAV